MFYFISNKTNVKFLKKNGKNIIFSNKTSEDLREIYIAQQ